MNKGLSLYIHWPFCRSKCPYCDFNSQVPAEIVDVERWKRALLAEMAYFNAESDDKILESVFFGGGTPSTMPPETTAALIDAARGFWPVAENLEITLEANPTSVEAAKLKDFAAAGVNRLSLGIQSFNDKSLKFLGREHSARQALEAISLAQETFQRYSFDLIYGLPDQSVDAWKDELNQGIEGSGGHLSLYQLSVENGTPFYRDRVPEADPDRGADLFQLTQEQTALKGLKNYEISNHAQPGEACRHNLAIWRGGDYAGIGPGAHGRLSGAEGTNALYQIRDSARWLSSVETKGHGTAKHDPLTPLERAEELLMTGLRLSEGLDIRRFQLISGVKLDSCLQPEGLSRLIEGGFLVHDNANLRATPDGRLRLNAVLAELLS